ncbi:hypothetical protein LguiA_020656 [Lonicera macranthoides]
MAVAAAQEPVSAQVVGNAFVQQYYHILHHSPALVHRFYQDISKLGRPEDDGSMSVTTTMEAINSKIVSLNYGEFRAEIKSVDAQESLNSGVHVLVTGFLTGKDNVTRNFAQSFFLAPQERGGYFVLNDIFRYVENANSHDENKDPASDVEAIRTPEQESSPIQENHITEQTTVLAEESNGEEVYDPHENVEVSVVEDEVPVAEVVDEVQDDAQMVVESTTVKIEEVPKKSFASIVMDLKRSTVPFSSPARTLRKSQPKSPEQEVKATPPSVSGTEGSVSSSIGVENGNNEEGEADGYSVYIKGLPSNATPSQLEEEFKKFGPIKSGGIQVRSNRQQGFTFGFVEYEVPSAVQKAIEASPIAIGGRQAVVEEKRSTNSRSNNRGRFTNGRGFGYRNEGTRGGRGPLEGSRGYSRGGEYNGRAEFGNNRGNNNNRGGGGLSNRGGDGYQRADSNGGRINRAAAGGVANGTAKNTAPQQPPTAYGIST